MMILYSKCGDDGVNTSYSLSKFRCADALYYTLVNAMSYEANVSL